MEGTNNPSPVLNATPAKEATLFCTSATLLPLRPCRRNTFQEGEFRCILTLLAPVATLLPTEPSPSPNVRFRPATFPRELRSVLGCPQRSFSCFRRAASRRFAPWMLPSLSFPFAGRPLRRARAASRVALCDLFSKSHVIQPFPCSPFDGLSNDRYRLRPSQRSQHLEWPLCAKTGPSLNVAFDPQTNKRTRTRPDAF